jgi:signal transduction histidine kinase
VLLPLKEFPMKSDSNKQDDLELYRFDALTKEEFALLIAELKDKRLQLHARERELEEYSEEFSSQEEELTAAIEELMSKNKSLEDTLHQLRERSFELDQILYRTSHDLRSPLSSIKGILTLLQLESKSDIITSYGKHIEDKATQMDNLLRSLASLSKSILEEPQLETIDLNKVIWQVIGEYRHLPCWNRVEVSVDLHEHKMKTDPVLIAIIFQSLFSNGFIFREPSKKGKLIIRTKEQDSNWIIEVIDDGEGVDPAVKPFIFNMFYRGSEKSIGNGLGLYVCRKAADRLKGNITFRTEQHTTHFIVTLPFLN